MNQPNRLIKPLIWSIVISIVLYGALVVSGDFQQVKSATARVEAVTWLIILCLPLTNYLFRFIRWQIYLRQFHCHIATGTSLAIYLGGFAFTTTPGKAGEAIRSLYLKRLGMSYTHSLAAFFVERYLDVVNLLLLSLLVITTYPDFRWLFFLLVPAVLLSQPLIHSLYIHNLLRKLAAATNIEKIKGSVEKILNVLQSSAAILKSIILYQGLSLGLIGWAAESMALYFVSADLGISVSLPLAISIYSISLLAGAISFVPGGLGSTEAVMTLLLTLNGTDMPSAIAATLICRVTSLWFAVFIGLISIAMLECRHLSSAPSSISED